MEVIRTIHPIGQGAFYTEKLTFGEKTVNVVYDCGCEMQMQAPPRALSLVKQWCQDVSQIDLLFISHFHADHMNCIKTILESKIKVKNVIIPYIHPDLLLFLTMYYQYYQNSIPYIFINPYDVFRNTGTNIITVHPADDDINRVDPISINQLQNNISLYSNQAIEINGWLYLPFTKTDNLKCTTVLQNHFAQHKWNINSSDWLYDKQGAASLKKIYTNYFKLLNETSLMVYSGPIREYLLDCFSNMHGCCAALRSCSDGIERCHRNPSCLYTGDITIDATTLCAIDKVINRYKIGTFQIPHHGSKNSWKHGYSISHFYKCVNYIDTFLSFGNNNRYRMPSIDLMTSFDLLNVSVRKVNENNSFQQAFKI